MSNNRPILKRIFMVPEMDLQHLLNCKKKLMKLQNNQRVNSEESPKPDEPESTVVSLCDDGLDDVLRPKNQLGYCYDLVLENLAFKQKVGATTMLKVLLASERFCYDPKSGQISIDGKVLPASNLTELVSICTRIYPPFVKPKCIDLLQPGLPEFVQLLASTSISAQLVCLHPALKEMFQKYRACKTKNIKSSNKWVEI